MTWMGWGKKKKSNFTSPFFWAGQHNFSSHGKFRSTGPATTSPCGTNLVMKTATLKLTMDPSVLKMTGGLVDSSIACGRSVKGGCGNKNFPLFSYTGRNGWCELHGLPPFSVPVCRLFGVVDILQASPGGRNFSFLAGGNGKQSICELPQ